MNTAGNHVVSLPPPLISRAIDTLDPWKILLEKIVRVRDADETGVRPLSTVLGALRTRLQDAPQGIGR
ncbi:hypothetical protein [Halocatena pleomorpha]|uniref:hypothetical protein n=1 Tax=Halocatena pleomorpha TaxID=1785090 RepID=UPI000F60B5B1|nr:hypothetical protein [Halocatena pleomorpha]